MSFLSNRLLSKKILFGKTGYSAYEYEYTYHLIGIKSSYYPNTCTALCCMGVCCNSPLLGRKGVRENEIF